MEKRWIYTINSAIRKERNCDKCKKIYESGDFNYGDFNINGRINRM
jgi:hypothetical protein